MGGRGSSSGKSGGGGGANNQKILREIENTGFKNVGSGVYTFDTPYGGGQIERGELPFVGKTYRAHAWNSNYDPYRDENTGPSGVKQFSSLSDAKSWVKNAVKKAAKR